MTMYEIIYDILLYYSCDTLERDPLKWLAGIDLFKKVLPNVSWVSLNH